MSFEDQNGDSLAVDDQVIIRGTVSAVRELSATVDVARQGSPVSLEFARTEPVVATIDDGTISGEITGNPVEKNDQVIILGTITDLATGIHDIANVEVTQNGEPETPTFYCSELIKATVDGNTITGALEGPTIPPLGGE